MNEFKERGNSAEKFVCDYLAQSGYLVKAKNYHSRYGEIDIIAENDIYIVFVEVKARKAGALVTGLEAVNKNKQNKIIKTSFTYLINNNSDKQPRFDVAEVVISSAGEFKSINYIENAFTLEEYNAYF